MWYNVWSQINISQSLYPSPLLEKGKNVRKRCTRSYTRLLHDFNFSIQFLYSITLDWISSLRNLCIIPCKHYARAPELEPSPKLKWRECSSHLLGVDNAVLVYPWEFNLRWSTARACVRHFLGCWAKTNDTRKYVVLELVRKTFQDTPAKQDLCTSYGVLFNFPTSNSVLFSGVLPLPPTRVGTNWQRLIIETTTSICTLS